MVRICIEIINLGHIKTRLSVWEVFKFLLFFIFLNLFFALFVDCRAGEELCFLLRVEEKRLEEDGEVVSVLSMLNNAYGLE